MGAPAISLTDTLRKIVLCRLGDDLRVAGLAELGNDDAVVSDRSMIKLVASARLCLPTAAHYDDIKHRWSGLRPLSPSSIPLIRKPLPNLVVNVGHGMLGWTLALGAGERAAALVESRHG
jgi:D-amino-acid dehydrogenase